MKEILEFLEVNSYQYNFDDNSVSVRLNKFLTVIIKEADNKINISYKSVKWNGLSGFFQLDFDKLVYKLYFYSIILFIFLEFAKIKLFDYDYTYVLILSLFNINLWFFYSYTIYQKFKSSIELIYFYKENSK